MANQTIWSFIKWIICINNLTISMEKVKVHSGNLLNDLTDRLAKESYKINFPTLTISNDFNHFSTMVKWANILVDKPHREFVKSLFQAQYFNNFLSLRRNELLWSLTINDKIDWKMTTYYFNFNGNKGTTDFDSSWLKLFKIKCLTSSLSTLSVLKIRYPFLYNNYEWTCPNNVLTVDYGNIYSVKRCKEEEDFTHLWTCPSVRHQINKLINDFKLRIIYDTKSCHADINVSLLETKLNRLQCFTFPTLDNLDFINLSKGLIPSELVITLHNAGYSYNNIQHNICNNLNILLKQFHKKVWIPRCEALHKRECTVGILPIHKRKGNFRIRPNNLTFPVINYMDSSNNHGTQHCDDDLWYNWTVYSCRAGKPWQDF